MTTISLGNIGSKKQVEKIIAAIDGKTYMNFKVEYGIDVGNYPTTVSSDYNGCNESEIIEMLLFCLATAL